MNNNTLFFFFCGHTFGLLFGGFIGFLGAITYIQKKNLTAAPDIRKWCSLAQKYADALLDIRGIALTALQDEEGAPDASYMSALENIRQTTARTLWNKEE